MKHHNLNVLLNDKIVCTVLIEAPSLEVAVNDAVEHADHEFGYNEKYNVVQYKTNKFKNTSKVLK